MTYSKLGLASLVAALLFLAGCPVPSFQPVSPAGAAAPDKRVVGHWFFQDNGKDGAPVEVTEKDGAYVAVVTDKDKATDYPVKLFKVGDATYLETLSVEENRKTWWLARIEVRDDEVQLYTWDEAKYGDISDDPAVLTKTLPSGTKLDMPPEKLAAFLKANAAKFSKPDLLFKRKP